MTPTDRAQFARDGFVVLRAAVDGAALPQPRATRTGVARVQLLRQFELEAEALLGGPVLPVRAKGMRYFGNTDWHTDSSHPLASVGFAAYLERLTAATGALRVMPGSHRDAASSEAVVLATEPGDVIVFDEHLRHASEGGGQRHQWRVDYLRDPVTDAEHAASRASFAGIFPPDWAGGYDVDAFPSYGSGWAPDAHRWSVRLRELGVFELAARQEEFSRRARSMA